MKSIELRCGGDFVASVRCGDGVAELTPGDVARLAQACDALLLEWRYTLRKVDAERSNTRGGTERGSG